VGRKPRTKPQKLHAKLLAIRRRLNLTQPAMAKRLEIVSDKRLCEFESGRREPNLLVLLRYARIAGCSIEHLIDDEIVWP
jgi:transcriptional regulator with XRE-family HTH domain